MRTGRKPAAALHGTPSFALCVFDAAEKLVFANAVAAEALGLPPDASGLPIAEIAALAERCGVLGAADAASRAWHRPAADRTGPQRCLLRRADGSRHELYGMPLPGGGFCVVDVEVTTRGGSAGVSPARARPRATPARPPRDGTPPGIGGTTLAISAGEEARREGGVLDGLLALVDAVRDAIQAGAADPAAPRTLREGRLRRHRPGGAEAGCRGAIPAAASTGEGVAGCPAARQAAVDAAQGAAVLQTMLDTMRHGIALYGADRRLVAANRLAHDLTGLTPEEMEPGRRMEELLDLQVARGWLEAEDAARLAAADRRRATRGTRSLPDGRVVEAASSPTHEGGYVVTWTDVTARARAEQEAGDQAALLRSTLDNVRHGIAMYGPGPDSRLLAANRLAGPAYGLPPLSERVGARFRDLVEEQARHAILASGDAAWRIADETLALDRSRSLRYVRQLRDGKIIEIESHPIPGGGFIVIHTDVTRLVRAEAAAADRAATLQATLDNVRHGITCYGPDRRVVAVNRLATEINGAPPGYVLVGRTLEEVLADQVAYGSFGDDAKAPLEMALSLDRTLPHRYVRPAPDGRLIEITSDPTPDGGFVITHADVTALAAAEAEAAARAETLRVMLENMRHGITYFGPDRRLIATNRLDEQFSGLPLDFLRPGRSLEELIAKQLELRVCGVESDQIAAMALALDRSQRHRYVRPTADGRVIEVTSDPTPDGGFIVTRADITALAAAEAEAAARAATLQVMLDHTRHGITYFGPDRRVIAANRINQDLGGVPASFMHPGRSIDELVAEQLAMGVAGTETRKVADKALALDRSQRHRYIRPTADGRIIEVTSDPTPDGGFIVTRADVTALAQAEADAKRRADIQQVMLDNIRHGICLVDADGRVVAANAVFRQLLDLPEEVGRPGDRYLDFVEWLAERGEYGEGDARDAAVAAIRDTDRRRSSQKVRPRRDGTVLEIASDPTPGGGFVLTFTDVTEDRRVRAELKRAKEAAEAANRAKSRFLAAVSHELRTPLNAVIGFSEALTASPATPPAGQYAKAILEAGRHLLTLIDDILEATRAESTGIAVAEGEADPCVLAERAIRDVAPEAEAGQLRLATCLPEGLPLVRADERRLRQVLRSLLSNAVKFTAPGGRVTVSAGLEPDTAGDALVLRVADTGIGMRAEDIPRAFEPFTQVDGGVARRFPGTGLGLYLARAMAEAQGATIVLESRPGQGTTAVLRFPPERLLPRRTAGSTDRDRPVNAAPSRP